MAQAPNPPVLQSSQTAMTMQTCAYTRYNRCPLPVESKGPHCILHDHSEAKDRTHFLEILKSKIDGENSDPATLAIDLSGVVFLPDFAWRDVSGDSPLQKVVTFLNARFLGDANFLGAQFIAPADFMDAKFSADADFLSAHFASYAGFGFAQFAAEANFLGAQFGAHADFGGARFAAEASFWKAQFSGEANFRDANFSDIADFRDSTFAGDAYFTDAQFSQAILFIDAIFNGNADFSHATFTQCLHFSSLNRRNLDQDATARLDLSSVILEQPQLVSFEDVDLSKASFLYTDISNVQFTNVIWAKKQDRFFRRVWHNVLYDHLQLERKEVGDQAEAQGHSEKPEKQRRSKQNEASLVATLYRQLRLNYEGSRQEVEAGHFYIGQMDMRIRNPDTGLYTGFAWRLYRVVAMYGESAWRPLFLYLLSSVMFAFLYLWCGFSSNGEVIHYAPFWSGGLTFPIPAYGKAWFIAATAGPLFRTNIQFVESWGYVVFFLNMVLGIFFIALFVIALRRQFRR